LFVFALRSCPEFIALTRRVVAGYVFTVPSSFEIAVGGLNHWRFSVSTIAEIHAIHSQRLAQISRVRSCVLVRIFCAEKSIPEISNDAKIVCFSTVVMQSMSTLSPIQIRIVSWIRMVIEVMNRHVAQICSAHPRTKSSLRNARHYHSNEKDREYRTNSRFRQEPNWS
jgi:hypothetical protein